MSEENIENITKSDSNFDSSSVHIDSENNDILILGEGPTQGLEDTILTAEPKYSINSTQPN